MILNWPEAQLPMAGGTGSNARMFVYAGGAVLLLAAGLLVFIMRKR